MAHEDLDLLQAARTEDLVYEQIAELGTLGDSERRIIETLKHSGAHLLQGARGVGKSMLLRIAEVEMDQNFKTDRKLAVYVNFKTSTLLEGVKAEQKDAFQIWVGAKILCALYEKLLQMDLLSHESVTDPFFKIFGIKSSTEIRTILVDNIHKLQKLSISSDKQGLLTEIGKEFLDKTNDPTFLHDFIKDVVEKFKIEKIVLLFDEAAHTFIPSQQEIFFEIFKLLHGGRIAVKAAVYPSVTSYGRNFEIGHDAILIQLDKFETGSAGRASNREFFRNILLKRLPDSGQLKKQLFSKGHLLDQCIDLSTGNPRSFFHLLNRTIEKGYTDRALLLGTQEFVDQELLPYHLSLSKRLPKFSHHVKVGLDILRSYIIPQIKEKNLREKKKQYQSAYFTIPRDMSPNLRLALDILCYSGILTYQGTVKIAERNTGLRYIVHLALLFTEKAFIFSEWKEIISAISLTDYREFSNTDNNILEFLKLLKSSTFKCSNCSTENSPNAKFCSECGEKLESSSIISGLLEESISSLSIGNFLKERVATKYSRIGDIIHATREEIMQIKYIKDARSRIIKNAAEEFISG
jgi:hypothetical protein